MIETKAEVPVTVAGGRASNFSISGKEISTCAFPLARRAASPVAEDERDLAKVRVDPRLFEALVAGYLRGAGTALLARERSELVFASQLMTLLLGMRFLADHLAGDRYFRIRRPGQNLDLARTQLALLGDFERQRDALEAIVAKTAAPLR